MVVTRGDCDGVRHIGHLYGYIASCIASVAELAKGIKTPGPDFPICSQREPMAIALCYRLYLPEIAHRHGLVALCPAPSQDFSRRLTGGLTRRNRGLERKRQKGQCSKCRAYETDHRVRETDYPCNPPGVDWP